MHWSFLELDKERPEVVAPTCVHPKDYDKRLASYCKMFVEEFGEDWPVRARVAIEIWIFDNTGPSLIVFAHSVSQGVSRHELSGIFCQHSATFSSFQSPLQYRRSCKNVSGTTGARPEKKH